MLRQLRRAADLTQVQLAVKMGRNRSYVSRYESGEKAIDMIDIRLILRALDKPFQEFMRKYDEALVKEVCERVLCPSNNTGCLTVA